MGFFKRHKKDEMENLVKEEKSRANVDDEDEENETDNL